MSQPVSLGFEDFSTFDIVRFSPFVVKGEKDHQEIRTRNQPCEYADNAYTIVGEINALADERGIVLFSVQPLQCRYRHWSGFWSQGDGASFEGTYAHARGAARAIRAHAPRDDELHRIADALQTAQKRNFYSLHSTIRQQGRYYHEYTMSIEVERDSATWQPPTDGAEDTVIEAMRDLARWLYRQLRAEYEHLTSDEAIDETLTANESTFTAAGEYFV